MSQVIVLHLVFHQSQLLFSTIFIYGDNFCFVNKVFELEVQPITISVFLDSFLRHLFDL
jgi:membrane protein YqaA with SNARE-associated domain